MRVLLLQPYLAPYRVGLFKALQGTGDIRLTLLYFGRPERRRRWKDGPRDPALEGIQLRSLVIPRGYESNWTIANVPHLALVLRRVRPDLVVCAPNTEGKWLRLLRRWGRYRVVVWTEQTAVTAGGRAPSRIMRRWFYPSVDAFIVPGREARRYLETSCGVPPDRIHEAPNTVDEMPYASTADEVSARFAAPGPRRVLFVGSLNERKGVDLLLDAARELRRRRPDLAWELHLAGAGPYQPAPEPGATLHGHLDAASCATLMKRCHVFALPSRHDCNPLSAIEAAKAGLILLLSDGCGNHPELASDPALVVARGSAPALAAALERVLALPADEAARLALVSRANGAAFAHDRSAAVFRQVFLRVLQGAPRGATERP